MWSAVALFLYLGSFGPAIPIFTWFGGLDGPDYQGVIYAPIYWLHDHTFLKGPIDAYQDWWFKVFVYFVPPP